MVPTLARVLFGVWCSWRAMSVLGSQVFGQTLMESCEEEEERELN